MMRRTCLTMVGILQAVAVFATDMPAVTAGGRKVLLSEDGTWKYAAAPAATDQEKGKPESKATASEKIELLRGKAAVNYNPTKWRNLKESQPGRFELTHKDGDVYATIITERLQMPINTLCKIALDNAREVAADAQVVLREQRMVNGTEMTRMQITATIMEIPFVYVGNYYTGKPGAIQMMIYTGENLLEENRADIEEFLGGLQIAKQPS